MMMVHIGNHLCSVNVMVMIHFESLICVAIARDTQWGMTTNDHVYYNSASLYFIGFINALIHVFFS